MSGLAVSPLSASTASPSSAGSRLTGGWFSTPISLPTDGPQPKSDCAGGAPWELWARTFAYLDDPASFALTCRLFNLIARDPILRMRWLVCTFGERGALRALLWRYPRLFTPSLGKAVINAARKKGGQIPHIPRWWLQCALRGLVAGRALDRTPAPGNGGGLMANAGNQAEMGNGDDSPVVFATVPPTPNNTPTDGVAAAPPVLALPAFLQALPDSPLIQPMIPLSPMLLTRTNIDGSRPIRISLSGKKANALLTFLVVLAEEVWGSKADMTGDDLADLAEVHGLKEAAAKMRADPTSFTWPIRTDDDPTSPMDDDEDDDFADPVAPQQQDMGVQAQAEGEQQQAPEQAAGGVPPQIVITAAPEPKISQRKLFLKHGLSPLHFGRLHLLPIHPLPTLPMTAPGRLAESPDLLLRSWNPLFEMALRDPKLFSAVMESLEDDMDLDADGNGICAELVGRLVLHARWRNDPGPATINAILDNGITRKLAGSSRKKWVVSPGQLAWLLERVDLFDGELCAVACNVVMELCTKQERALGRSSGDAMLLASALIFLRENPTSLFAFFERFRGLVAFPSLVLETLFNDEKIRRGATRNRFVTPWQVCRKLATYVPVWDGIRGVIADYIEDRTIMIRMLEGLWPFSDPSRLQSHAELFTLANVHFSDALVMYSGSSSFLKTDAKSHSTIINQRWAPYLDDRGKLRCVRSLLDEMANAVDEFASAARKDCAEEPVSPGSCLCGEASALFWQTLSYPFEWLAEAFPSLGKSVISVLITAISAACGSGKLRTAVGEAINTLRRCTVMLDQVAGEPAVGVHVELLDFVRGTKVTFPEDREFLKLFFELCRTRTRIAGAEERESWKVAALGIAKEGRNGKEWGDALGFKWWLSNILLPEFQ